MPAPKDISMLSEAEQKRILAARARGRKYYAKLKREQPERIQARRKRRYAKLRSMDKTSDEWKRVLETNRRWKRENAEKRAAAARKKWSEDIQFRLRKNLRLRLRLAVKGERAGSAVRDLGCTVPELIAHLEAKFEPGMSWENYGQWHIDHRIPLSWFDLTDREQLLRACHFTNLQPKWAGENLKKGASLEAPSLL